MPYTPATVEIVPGNGSNSIGIQVRDLLSHQRIGGVGHGQRVEIERVIREQAIDAASLVFELAHGLTP